MDARSGSQVPWIVLDSTVLSRGDRFFEGFAARIVAGEATAGRLRLVVPETVVLECSANHERDVYGAVKSLESAQDALTKFRANAAEFARFEPRLSYGEDLREIIRQAGGEIWPIPDVPHLRLVEKAVARKRPFNDKGDGYRDTLVWEVVLEVLRLTPAAPVALISNDRGAFARPNGVPELARDLEDELNEFGHAARCALFFTLDEYVRARVPASARAVGEWQHKFEDSSELRESLVAALLHVARRDVNAIVAPNLPGSTTTRPSRFVHLENPRGLRVEEGYVFSETTALEVSVAIDYELRIDYLAEEDTPALLMMRFPRPPRQRYLRGVIRLTFQVDPHGFIGGTLEPTLLERWSWEQAGLVIQWNSPTLAERT
jgi:hypothetical protein